jgi:hypothetical protein
VTEARAIDGALVVQWLAFHVYLHRGDETIELNNTAGGYEVGEGDVGATLESRMELATKEFPIGSLVEFSPSELLAICLFYNIVVDRVTFDLQNAAKEAGVNFTEAQAATTNDGGAPLA